MLLDVADPRSGEEAMARVGELAGGGAWAVVNNAGIPQAGSVEDVSDEQARRLLETNLLGAARICRLALPAMRRRGRAGPRPGRSGARRPRPAAVRRGQR
ncbi:SDR family NAD(P)-dependent oxidoreductase [Kitasatospora sp. NBC_00315]|uniref:SDR family NAD(P)-dependent oxidoreductase n=1 Tax=Kitasatospora sp. NBC_00315 TaxID=2975963 RepID=UPI003253CEE7